ncbi:MAG: transglutaminase N-terminal domain-containing protein [Nitrospiria bacterium]
MNYRIVHQTIYEYSGLMGLCHNEARLKPRELPNQQCLNTTIQIDPAPADYLERLDFFGNRVAYFSIQQPHERLAVTATSDIAISAQQPRFEFGNVLTWETVRNRLRSDLAPEILNALQFTLDSPVVQTNDALAAYGQPSFPPGQSLVTGVRDLMHRIHADFTYDPEFTSIATPLSEVLLHRRGVCQDFAHLAIACLRAQGLAARYVSGYVETVPPPGKERRIGADASHAWFSVYLPDHGWFDFDPTNDQMPMDRHIVIAWGRDFSDVTPLKGIGFGEGKHRLKVSVDVSKIE